jgi:transcriptional regulator with XRE-family HTH domain
MQKKRLTKSASTPNTSQEMASRKSSTPLYRQAQKLRLGPWLRELRQKKDLALREVAAAVQMDQAHLSKAELGQRIPTSEQVARLAVFFIVPTDQMEGRRVAEKVMQEITASPAAKHALSILREEPFDLLKRK